MYFFTFVLFYDRSVRSAGFKLASGVPPFAKLTLSRLAFTGEQKEIRLILNAFHEAISSSTSVRR